MHGIKLIILIYSTGLSGSLFEIGVDTSTYTLFTYNIQSANSVISFYLWHEANRLHILQKVCMSQCT